MRAFSRPGPALALTALALAGACAGVPEGGTGADGAAVEIVGAGPDGTGISVALAGDVNGDGIDDLLIGAPFGGRAGAGSAYLLFGPLESTRIDLGALPSGVVRIDGAARGDLTGRWVASAGDLNGDGLADILVGAPAASSRGRPSSGSADVVFGAPSPHRRRRRR